MNLKKICAAITLIGLCVQSANALDPEDITLSELNWIDKKYFDKQRAKVDDLGRENFGTRIRTSKADLELLQRILDNDLISLTDSESHKALGIVLGDIYVSENGWQWQEYKDKEGKSRGVCVPKTEQCVFPISMMTRRLRVTTKINIAKIYDKGMDLMAEARPQLPYSYDEPTTEAAEERPSRNTITVPFR